LEELLQHRPVQYVLGEAWFANMPFYVNESVLIPRPETEELTNLIVQETKYRLPDARVLDIGSGSGCIPIALKKQLPQSRITSVDISAAALEVAKRNASALNAAVVFMQMDFLDKKASATLPLFNIIAGNPPYVKTSESASIHKNVLEYEPHTALFVPDNDVLIFYNAIAQFGLQHLHTGGKIYVEINETLGKETAALFEHYGYQTDLKQDLQGKDRIIKAEY
jgi:release factor glutamine methyltransferase